MATFIITTRDGVNLGGFEAETPSKALNAMARDAGFRTYEHECAYTKRDPKSWTTSREQFSSGNFWLLVERTT